jgi:DNA-binding NtrC family response regulator
MANGVPQAASFSAEPLNNPTALRVLVVDDELLIRWSLAETLTARGHVVSQAENAAAARRAIALEHPDVVLLDFRLPDSNDLGLLEGIRRDAPDTQVIVMTAYGTPEMAKGALDLGAYRVLSKPFAMQDAAALVSEAHAAAH